MLAWGSNASGQLGLGARDGARASPCEVWGLIGHACVATAAGAAHSVVLTSEGDVYAMGYNWFGALGVGDERLRTLPAAVPLARAAAPTPGAPGHRRSASVSSAASRGPTSAPLLQQHWSSQHQRPPESQAVFIAAGGDSTYCITAAGTCVSFGGNSCGQLGLGDRKQRLLPCTVNDLTQARVTRVAAGATHALFLTHAGAVYACGAGWDGKLGFTSADGNSDLPATVTGLAHTRIVEVAAGTHASAGVDTAGRVHVWGTDVDGGGGADGSRVEPAACDPRELRYPEPIARVAIGGGTLVLALGRSGAVYVHGRGCLGLGRADDTCAAPRQLRSLAGVHCLAASAGASHTLVVSGGPDEASGYEDAARAQAERRRASAADVAPELARPLLLQVSASGEPVEPLAPSEATALAAMALRQARLAKSHALRAALPSALPVHAATAPQPPQPVAAAPPPSPSPQVLPAPLHGVTRMSDRDLEPGALPLPHAAAALPSLGPALVVAPASAPGAVAAAGATAATPAHAPTSDEGERRPAAAAGWCCARRRRAPTAV